MNVKKWILTHFPTLKRENTVGDALRKMREFSCDYSIVLDENDKFEGVIYKSSIRDSQFDEKIEMYVTFPDFYVVEDSNVEEAALMLIENKDQILPVVNNNAEVIGVLTVQEVLEAFTELSAMDERGTRIILELEDKPGELKKMIDVLANNKMNILSILTLKENNKRQVSIKIQCDDPETVANLLEIYNIKYLSIIEEEGF
ncbi:signal transduction protein [Thermosipho melanesiensis]|uniref:Signal transduction protein n=2 Tax=Thermosipho melanesiensis TaxID=46541 RepID=A0ABN4UVP6_9BACT|nr:CBS domain-containing protein [Thermosipho melanesiensis]ABR31153.1 putative signal-transduction protein with CBS domains [Thermosipho melanesiensis BI429]APT74243.1 signal transduction protein [Thermosipho melanesiensis]OOC36184.1 signal transduction protein [Thermosipho melanesiensis]OOC37002.1 signal transduction protein [Thermosipho melanesiensis]OOC37754.1 signal transduction protein [Thermosipho melanesiensis]